MHNSIVNNQMARYVSTIDRDGRNKPPKPGSRFLSRDLSSRPDFRRRTMTKSKIAVLATLATLVAAPAFAGDQDTWTELQDSGRYVPQASLTTIPSGAYASARQAPRAGFKVNNAV